MSYKENLTNAYQKWSDEEYLDFIKETLDGIDMMDIALLHKRSYGSIYRKTVAFVAKDVTERGISIEQVSHQYHIKPRDLRKYINQLQNKSTIAKLEMLDEKIDILTDRIDMLENKIDFVIRLHTRENLDFQSSITTR